jgi:hypothetical protein
VARCCATWLNQYCCSAFFIGVKAPLSGMTERYLLLKGNASIFKLLVNKIWIDKVASTKRLASQVRFLLPAKKSFGDERLHRRHPRAKSVRQAFQEMNT